MDKSYFFDIIIFIYTWIKFSFIYKNKGTAELKKRRHIKHKIFHFFINDSPSLYSTLNPTDVNSLLFADDLALFSLSQ